jgi:hypothetical protein
MIGFWHFFTITLNCDSSQSVTVHDSLHSLLDHERLLFLSDEWRTKVPADTLNCLDRHLSDEWILEVGESYVATDGQSASLSWNKAPICGLRPDFYYCQTVAGLLIRGAVSDERTGLSFTIAAGFASAVILGSESRGIRDHILLSQIGDSLFVAPYYSQGYGGGFRSRLHTGILEESPRLLT